MYKKMGLNSDIVCEVGKWKNLGAFQAHYLRLNAAESAGGALASFVHSVSPEGSAEPDRSRTPARNPDGGGSDREGGAQSSGETRYSFAGENVNCSEGKG